MSWGFPELCGGASVPTSEGSSKPQQTALHTQFLCSHQGSLVPWGELLATPAPPQAALTPSLPPEQSSSRGPAGASHQEVTQAGFPAGSWEDGFSGLLASGGQLVVPSPVSPQGGPHCVAGDSASCCPPTPCLPFSPFPRLGLHWMTEGGCSALP